MPKAIVWVRVNEVSKREEITCIILLTHYCTLNWLIYEPCSPFTEWPPIQCLGGHSSDWGGVGWGGWHSLIWLKRVCDVDQGVWFRILSPKTVSPIASFSFLNRVSFWTGSVERWWPVFICGSKYFLQKKLIPLFLFEKKKT